MKRFLNEFLETMQNGFILFAMFFVCLVIAVSIGYSVFGEHGMLWLRLLGFVAFVFLLGRLIKV
jgi:hypothetical protein